MEPATIIYRPWRYIIYTSGGKFHQEQSFSTDGDLLFGHKLSPNEPFWPSWQDILEKIWGYKDTGSFFVTLFSLPSPSRCRRYTNYKPISGHHSLTHSRTLFNLLLTATVHHVTHPCFAFFQSCSPSGPSLHNRFTKHFLSNTA